VRFPSATTVPTLQAFVDEFKQESERQRRARREAARAHAGTFAGDAARYLALAVVRAMPSYTDRVRQIGRWVTVFRRRPRSSVTAREIDEQLQQWRDGGDAASTVNKHRTALMSLYSRLDGRAAANPVRHTHPFEEPAAEARGLSYTDIRALLDAMPRDRGQPPKGGRRDTGSRTRARFELMAWTGMTPSQIKQLQPRHVDIAARWYISPPRRKGHRRPRQPRPEIKKPMTRDARAAFVRFIELQAWGDFSNQSMRHTLERARRHVEARRRRARRDPEYVMPPVRPYDFRHSFGTELFRRTGNLPLVAEMLDHSSLQMTKRYALGAVSDVLKAGMRRFQQGAGRGRQR
jgi:integrase